MLGMAVPLGSGCPIGVQMSHHGLGVPSRFSHAVTPSSAMPLWSSCVIRVQVSHWGPDVSVGLKMPHHGPDVPSQPRYFVTIGSAVLSRSRCVIRAVTSHATKVLDLDQALDVPPMAWVSHHNLALLS